MYTNLTIQWTARQIEKGSRYDVNIRTQNTFERRAGSYYKGLQGLSAEDRASWEKQYSDYIQGKSDAYKNDIFRMSVFADFLSKSDNEEDKQMYEKYLAGQTTKSEREQYFAKRAMEEDMDGKSTFLEDVSKRGRHDIIMYNLHHPEEFNEDIKPTDTSAENLRDQALSYLEKYGYKQSYKELEILENDIDGTAEVKRQQFLEGIRELFPYFNEYEGKLDLSTEETNQILANYNSMLKNAGEYAAYAYLNKEITNRISYKQTFVEKAGNTVAQFTDSGAGMIIRAVGMVGGLTGLLGDDEDSYWNNIIDNPWTRYGDRVATTHSWKKAEQLFLEENGMSDNPILNSYEQQNKLLTGNSVFELLGQYGFTTASTILSLGSAGLINLGFKGIGWLSKVGNAGKALNTTTKGVKLLRHLSKSKDALITLSAGAVGTVEGGMNAVQTFNITKKNLDSQANQYRMQLGAERFASQIKEGLNSGQLSDNYIINTLLELGVLTNTSSREEIDYAVQQFKSNPKIIDQIAKELFTNKENQEFADSWILRYAPDIDQDYADLMQRNKEMAERAMYTDFAINSAINGMANVTLKAGLNAAPVRNAINRTFGISGKPKWSNLINIEGNKATAKYLTKARHFIERSQQAIGEGLEEYSQELSSQFGQQLANSGMQQYYNYLAGDRTDLYVEDVSTTISEGLKAAGEAAVSKEALKSGIYGALSTFLGGLNVNTHYMPGKKLEGESTWEYLSRKTPIIWNSSLNAFLPGSTKAENERREKLATYINTFLQDEQLQKLFLMQGQSVEWMAAVDRALREGDEKAVHDARVGQMVHAILSLNATEGSSYYDATQLAIQQRVNFKVENLQDPNSAESKAVAEYRQSIGNVESSNPMSDQQVLERIKKQANKFVEMQKKVSEYSEEFRGVLGDMADEDALNSLIIDQIMLDSSNGRAESLDRHIREVEGRVRSSITPNAQTSKPKSLLNIIANFGTKEEFDRTLQEGKQHILELQEKIKEKKDTLKRLVKGSTKWNTETKAIEELQSLLDYYKSYQKKLVEMDDKLFKELDDSVENLDLTVEDILNMDSMQKSLLLSNDTNKKIKVSNTTRQSIDRYKKLLKEKGDTHTIQEVIDRGAIERDAKSSAQRIYTALSSPKDFSTYAQKQKLEAAKRAALKKFEYLRTMENTEENYKQFASDLNNSEGIDRWAAIQQASRNEMYRKYQTEEIAKSRKKSNIIEDSKILGLNDQGKKTFNNIIDWLTKNNVDIDNVEAVSQYILENYDSYKEQLDSNDIIEGINSTAEETTTFISDAIRGILNYRQQKAQESRIEEVTDDKPKQIVNEKEEAEKKIQKAKDRIVNLNNSNLTSLVAALSNDFPNLHSAKWEEVANICEKHNKIDTYPNIREFKLAIINDLVDIGIRAERNSYLEKWAKENGFINVLSHLRQSKGTNANPQYENTIETISISNIYSEALKNYYTINSITDFLKTIGDNFADYEVVYIVDKGLYDSCKESMGQMFNDTNIPIVAAVKVEEGKGIQIGDAYYQPIGIMPANTNTNTVGANNIISIREQAVKNITTAEFESFVITDEQGKPFKSTIVQKIGEETIDQVANSPVVLAAKEATVQGKPLEQIQDLQDSAWHSFITQKWFKDARQAFIERIRKMSYSQGIGFAYVIPRQNGKEDTRNLRVRSFENSRATMLQNRPTLAEVVQRENNDILNFNDLINQIYKVLSNISTEIESTKSKDSFKNKSEQEILNTIVKQAFESIYIPGYIIQVAINPTNTSQFGIALYTDTKGNINAEQEMISSIVGEISEDGTYTLQDTDIANFIKSILWDNTTNKFREGVKWQMSTSWMKEDGTVKAYNRWEYLYNSDLLEIDSSSLNTNPKGIMLSNPSKTKSSPTPPAPVKPNIERAQTNTKLNEEKPKVRTLIDQIKATDEQIKRFIQNALTKLQEIDAKLRQDRAGSGAITTLLGDNILTQEGVDLFPTEQGIQGIQSEGTEEQRKKVAYPIGNTIDAFVRDLFEDKIVLHNGQCFYYENGEYIALTDIYPNIAHTQAQGLAKRLLSFKQQKESQGLTFISTEYMIQGSLEVTLENGKKGKLNYHGIPDLMAYDSNGNFYVYDTKTFRFAGAVSDSLETARAKARSYAPQVTLYALALEQMLGVKVLEVGILPISVAYTDTQVKNAIADTKPFSQYHSETDRQGNPKVKQLGVKDSAGRFQPFSVNPQLISGIIIPVERVTLSTNLEAAVIKGIVQEVEEEILPREEVREEEEIQVDEIKVEEGPKSYSADDPFADLDERMSSEGYVEGAVSIDNSSLNADLSYDSLSDRAKQLLDRIYGNGRNAWNSGRISEAEKENFKHCR